MPDPDQIKQEEQVRGTGADAQAVELAIANE